jgi:fructose-1-phosphate kinase PfkB-like protein
MRRNENEEVRVKVQCDDVNVEDTPRTYKTVAECAAGEGVSVEMVMKEIGAENALYELPF